MKLSVIIPVRSGGPDFERCLAAVNAARRACAELAETELIVVDDGSADDSRNLAAAAQARVLATSGGAGPAAARNLGAQSAAGDYLFFTDADTVLHPDALRRAAAVFAADPTLEACFGSYDDQPAAPNFISQYKNLLHHFVHQQARVDAATFWTGCGAMRARTFAALGGFDARTYPRPSVEDIDLGYRLRRRGGKIHLLKAMQCRHLKRWTAGNLLWTDIVERGIPWTVLLWRERRAAGRPFQLDLNLQQRDRLSAACAGLLALALPALIIAPGWWPAPLLLAATLVWLNRGVYRFFYQKRGLPFALAAIPWHWLYHLYNNFSFALGTLRWFTRGARPVNADGSLPAE
jgi:GT2 family glycosyltransferase